MLIFQNEEKNDTLTEAKDKAQIAATTAMLVIHIGLLIDVIGRGPTQIRFYTARIVLVSLAIVLQVSAGLTALIIANVRKYFRKHKAGFCADICGPCGCQSEAEIRHEKKIERKVKRKKEAALNGTWDFIHSDQDDASAVSSNVNIQSRPSGASVGPSDRSSNEYETNYRVSSGLCCWSRASRYPPEQRGQTNSNNAPSRCCCLNRSTKLSYEDEILENHEIWMELSVLEQLSAVRPQRKWEMWNKQVEKHEGCIKPLKKQMKHMAKDEDKYKDKIQTVSAKVCDCNVNLAKARKQRQDYAKILRNQSIFRTQGKILGKYAIAIRKNRVLKCISVWQHGINYMLYAIFILNALIVGFGSMSSSDSSDSDCIEECVCPTVPSLNITP